MITYTSIFFHTVVTECFTYFRMLVAYGELEGAISVVLIAHGHSLLVAFPTRIALFHIVYHSLREFKLLFEGHIGKVG